MADNTIVDLQALASETALLLARAKEEFESGLSRIQDVIDNIDWWELNENTLIDEIGTVTFRNYESVKDEIENTTLEITRQRNLFETDSDKSVKHVFVSSSLDQAEAAVLSVVNGAGIGDLKALSGVMLKDAMRIALIAGQSASDTRDHNDMLDLMERYRSRDTDSNRDWLIAQFARGDIDRRRNIFSTLFSMAQESVQWASNQGVSIERLHENFTARYNRLYFDMTAANIAIYEAEVRGNIAEFEASLQALDAEMSIEQLKLRRDSTEWQLKIEQANSRLKAFLQEYKAKIATNKNLLGTRIVALYS